VSHPDSLARRPIDPAMGNSFGSYSEPGTRHSYEAEASPMVRNYDDVAPELRRRRSEGVGSNSGDEAGMMPQRESEPLKRLKQRPPQLFAELRLEEPKGLEN